MRQSIALIVDVDSTKMSYKELRENIKAAINLTPGALFEEIHCIMRPDPFQFDDPDDIPQGVY